MRTQTDGQPGTVGQEEILDGRQPVDEQGFEPTGHDADHGGFQEEKPGDKGSGLPYEA